MESFPLVLAGMLGVAGCTPETVDFPVERPSVGEEEPLTARLSLDREDYGSLRFSVHVGESEGRTYVNRDPRGNIYDFPLAYSESSRGLNSLMRSFSTVTDENAFRRVVLNNIVAWNERGKEGLDLETLPVWIDYTNDAYYFTNWFSEDGRHYEGSDGDLMDERPRINHRMRQVVFGQEQSGFVRPDRDPDKEGPFAHSLFLNEYLSCAIPPAPDSEERRYSSLSFVYVQADTDGDSNVDRTWLTDDFYYTRTHHQGTLAGLRPESYFTDLSGSLTSERLFDWLYGPDFHPDSTSDGALCARLATDAGIFKPLQQPPSLPVPVEKEKNLPPPDETAVSEPLLASSLWEALEQMQGATTLAATVNAGFVKLGEDVEAISNVFQPSHLQNPSLFADIKADLLSRGGFEGAFGIDPSSPHLHPLAGAMTVEEYFATARNLGLDPAFQRLMLGHIGAYGLESSEVAELAGRIATIQ